MLLFLFYCLLHAGAYFTIHKITQPKYASKFSGFADATVEFGCLKHEKCSVCVYASGLSDFIVMGIKGGAKVICLMQ